jgi:hypothetical protein
VENDKTAEEKLKDEFYNNLRKTSQILLFEA